jgi:hypothetical protein
MSDELERKLKRERVERCLNCRWFEECNKIGEYEECVHHSEIEEEKQYVIISLRDYVRLKHVRDK